MLDRKVKQIYTIKDGDSPDSLIRSFSSFLKFPNLVLLGDPGAGKSFLFEMACKEEDGALETARSFLIYSNTCDPNKPLYIDALDEKRSRTDNPQSIDEIVRRVVELKPAKLRISCRAADWLGETDLNIFKPYFESSGEYAVISLLALTDDEIDQILVEMKIEDASNFRKTAEAKGVRGLLGNPMTLILLAKSVATGGWPKTKKDLYEKASTQLFAEHNDSLSKTGLGTIGPSDLFEPAGAICASMLISDTPNVSLRENSTNIEFPPYTQVPHEDDKKI